MPTNDPVPAARRVLAAASIVALAAVLVGVGLLLRRHAPGNMGTGFLVGAGGAMFVGSVVAVRAWTRPGSASTFTRAFTQVGDERDDAILTGAFAVMGATSLPLTGLAAVAVGLGADVAMVLAVLLFVQVAIGTGAFVAIDRRS